MNDGTAKTPVHLWIVGIVTLLWNAIWADVTQLCK
jgi:hypothetical protein